LYRLNILLRSYNAIPEIQGLLATVIYALEALPAASGSHDLLRLNTAAYSDDSGIERINTTFARRDPQTHRIDGYTPPYLVLPTNTSVYQHGSFANLTEHHKHEYDVLREELEYLYISVPNSFEACFKDVPGLRPVAQTVFDNFKKGDSPPYPVEND
jgi:hypothetical protein